jgi:hypothetical protein
MGLLNKTPESKELEELLYSFANDFALAANGAMPTELLNEIIDEKGPRILALADRVREAGGQASLDKALKKASSYAQSMSTASYGGGRLGYTSFISTLNDLMST